MSITLTTSAGEVLRPVKERQFEEAMRRLMMRTEGGGLTFVHLRDGVGNEMTLTARGTLRVYFADQLEHHYALRLGVGHGVEMCRRFFNGDMEWVGSQPWERDLPVEEGEMVSEPLPGMEQTKPAAAPPPLPSVESAESGWKSPSGAESLGPAGEVEGTIVPVETVKKPEEPAEVGCPKCGMKMKQGYLTVRVGRADLMVHWGTGGLGQMGWTTYIRQPEDSRPVIALRCAHCGQLEFRA